MWRPAPPLLLMLLLTSSPTLAAPALPPAESASREVLESSPRHGEFVDVAYVGHAPLRTWVVHPERRDKAGVVIVLHEIFGLTDWIRAITDRLAADGFIAVAPDLLSGLGPDGGGTESTSSRDEVVQLVRKLTPQETAARIAAVREWARRLPSTNGKVATLGFCWGGARAFESAGAAPPPNAVVVFYGGSPDSAGLAAVRAPVLAHYGGDDARITSTLDATRARMKALGRDFEPHVYEGAGHGFVRQQEGREGANRVATELAWPRTLAFLRRRL